MKFLKRCLVVTILLLIGLIAKSQTSDEWKYLMVLTYLRTNKEINSHIKDLFVKRKLAKEKDPYVEFNLNDRIGFLSYSDFIKKLNSLSLIHI